MKRLLDGMFIVTLVAIACVEAALLMDKIDGPVYAGLMTAAVGGFMALASKQDKL